MKPARRYIFRHALLLTTALVALAACNAFDRMTDIGADPKLDNIQNPTKAPGYIPVSMPMPPPGLGEQQPNSLWHTGARAFFRDQRASRVGDILTVVVTINDQAQLQNETQRARTNTEDDSLTNFFGFESLLQNWFPKAVDPTSLANISTNSTQVGNGSVNRSEQINLRVAVTISQVLPNGNLVLHGRQQVSVNFDLRDLEISGVIRPEDIASDNTITYDQIAEARIRYGGHGQIEDIQQPRYGEQIFDILMPF